MIKTIGIIGGSGKMGSSFSKNFQKIGIDVIVSDEKSQIKEKELLSKSDWIILCVPIDRTLEAFKKIKNHISKDQVFSDFTSIKSILSLDDNSKFKFFLHATNSSTKDPSLFNCEFA